MNVLMFTMTMLMILAMMTYARIESFRAFSTVKAQFEHYMTKVERQFYSDQAESWYATTVVNKKSSPGDAKSPRSGTPYLSWSLLVDPNSIDRDVRNLQEITEISKKLMQNLFGKNPEFQKQLQDNPEVLDQLLRAIQVACENLTEDKKIKDSNDLANLALGEPALDLLLYKMLKGFHLEIEKTQETQAESSNFVFEKLTPQQEITQDSQVQAKLDAKENSNSEVISLDDYITFKKDKTRIFLASKPLLEAIFNDENVVKEILTLRYNIYRELMNGSIQKPEASKKFQTMLEEKYSFLNPKLFEYTVTKVNPRNYE